MDLPLDQIAIYEANAARIGEEIRRAQQGR